MSLVRFIRRPYPVAAAIALVSGLACSDDPTNPTDGGGSIENLTVTVPRTAIAGESFSVTISGGASGDIDGTLALSVTTGTVTPADVAFSGGTVDFDVTIDGVAGTVALRAAIDGVSGEGTIVSLATRELFGGDGDLAADVTPDIPYEPRGEDFSADHPEAPGMLIAHNTLLILPETDTTIGELNAILTDHDALIVGATPGRSGVAAGPLTIRVPDDDHAALDALAAVLRDHPKIRAAAPDITITTTLEPKDSVNAPTPFWVWNNPPAGGNWGMELIRAPQMWNWNPALRKAGASVPTGIVDSGFDAFHSDLSFANTPLVIHDHGTHVAGTIGASFDNDGVGVDGMNPFASMTAVALESGPISAFLGRISWGNMMHNGFEELMVLAPDVRVVNMSLGYNWSNDISTDPPTVCAGIDTNASVFARTVASNHGLIFDALLDLQNAVGNLPIIVVAAGNDSDCSFGVQQAMWASPMCNAALEHGNTNIIVVESVAYDPTADGSATRSDFSNIGGHISAPGSGILSTTFEPPKYEVKNGTSMATPHVTGLIGYLYALDPDLTVGQIRQLLTFNAETVSGGAADRIDAFPTAFDIDNIRGNDALLRMLCDIDDGSADGNTRVDLISSAPVGSEDLDGDGGVGDGVIDMSDFRRWRDWLLQVEAPPGLALDGDPSHVKLDIDGDGDVTTAADENVYPRGDFNGDGKLSRTDVAFVPGSIELEKTDLELLQAVFSDPNYGSGDLSNLLDSADIHVFAASCLGAAGVAEVVSRVESDGALLSERTHTSDEAVEIYTVPVPTPGVTVTVEARDAAGNVVASTESTFFPSFGEDIRFQAECATILLEAQLPEAVEPGSSFPIFGRAGLVTAAGDTVFSASTVVEFVGIGGTVDPITTNTDANGEFTVEGTMDADAFDFSAAITARLSGGETRTIIVATRPLVDIWHSRTYSSVLLRRNAGPDSEEFQESDRTFDIGGVNVTGVDLSASLGDDFMAGSAASTSDLTRDGSAFTVTGSGTTSLRYEPNGSSGTFAGTTNAGLILKFDVRGRPATYAIAADLSLNSSTFTTCSIRLGGPNGVVYEDGAIASEVGSPSGVLEPGSYELSVGGGTNIPPRDRTITTNFEYSLQVQPVPIDG